MEQFDPVLRTANFATIRNFRGLYSLGALRTRRHGRRFVVVVEAGFLYGQCAGSELLAQFTNQGDFFARLWRRQNQVAKRSDRISPPVRLDLNVRRVRKALRFSLIQFCEMREVIVD